MKSKYENYQRCGLFAMPNRSEILGNLTLDRRNSKLLLHAESAIQWPSHQDILGCLGDGTKVSLINCIGTGGQLIAGDGKYWRTIYPHYVCIGNHHVTQNDEKIRSIEFSINDGSEVFTDNTESGVVPWIDSSNAEKGDAFKLLTQQEEIRNAVTLLYYNGNPSLFDQLATSGGTISARKIPTIHSSLTIDDKVRIKFKPKVSAQLERVLGDISAIRQFFEFITGRAQNCLDIQIQLDSCNCELDVYQCSNLRQRQEPEKKFFPTDLPLDFSSDPDEFKSVFSSWLDSHPERVNARSDSLKHIIERNNYDQDRLSRSANAFDQLPGNLYPSEVPIDDALTAATDQTKLLFRTLPQSPERDSVLGALGRVGKFSLKRKIRHRSEIITARLPQRLPKLSMVTDAAVDVRNLFVHGHNKVILRGAEGKAELTDDQIDQFYTFFTRSLEFVFWASDLVDAGWDIENWCTRTRIASHPIQKFLDEYQKTVSELESLLVIQQ